MVGLSFDVDAMPGFAFVVAAILVYALFAVAMTGYAVAAVEIVVAGVHLFVVVDLEIVVAAFALFVCVVLEEHFVLAGFVGPSFAVVAASPLEGFVASVAAVVVEQPAAVVVVGFVEQPEVHEVGHSINHFLSCSDAEVFIIAISSLQLYPTQQTEFD